MKTIDITHPKVTRENLIVFAKNIPGAWIGLKVAALLLVLEGQRGMNKMNKMGRFYFMKKRGLENCKAGMTQKTGFSIGSGMTE